MDISISVVLYKTTETDLKKTLNDIIIESAITIYLIDNSPTDVLKNIVVGSKIHYIHNPSNPGFGAAHNIAITRAIEAGSKYHFVVNPDAYFEEDVITPMVNYMSLNKDVGMMMPKIVNENGTVQNLPKLLPSPYSIFMRKLKRPKKVYDTFINRYELRTVPDDVIYNAPILSGCFTLLNLDAIKEVGMYDDIFFMYFEDWDLSRRMHAKYKTIYFPRVSVYHGYESGANKSSKLFKIFINSAITYFNKWGWFFDSNRVKVNKKALAQFKK
ncbi:glycosyltransferase family 2 protein [Flavobacterium sp. I-SCBP12n]|uniref:Glycosyltransferase family 2 protein n=1 Tax=Flavobacterium pygoscelis TaxID=2893176 RepID=A0A9X1XQ08_9FLAO|nr:glycosyltransferase family 2 protein [Flavobacterium pygoscelis]MCK8141455.1 glycosyltransferase family 2 protein [Flavobacterium pygoscelis]